MVGALKLVLLGLLCLEARAENVVTVFPTCDEGTTSCVDINSALEEMQSNTTLFLLEGDHTVRNVTMVVDVNNIKILGNRSDPSLVRITCEPDVGLAFANITNFELSGISIEKCGLNGRYNAIKIFSEFIGRDLKPFVVLSPNNSVALLVGDCYNFLMENVTLQNNIGFGMVGFNLIGNSRLSGLDVLSNYPSTCDFSLQGGATSGGGIALIYEDYNNYDSMSDTYELETTLTIENSVFANNYICNVNLFTTQYNKLSRSIATRELTQGPYTIDGGGALNVGFSQGKYQVNAFIKSCTFRNNSGIWTGSALNLVQFESTNNSHIYVENSNFYDNGGGLVERYGTLDSFGALLALFYVPFPLDSLTTETTAELLRHEPSTIEVTGCKFRNNQAVNGGAASVFSFGPAIGFIQDEIHFSDCDFSNNMAEYGSAIFVTEISYSAFEPGLDVFFKNINVTHNSRRDIYGDFQSETGAMDINFLNVRFSGNNRFENNMVTALSAYSGIITMSGDSIFHSNTGVTGGALHLDTESYLVLEQTANISFIENHGLLAGGAIFVDFQTIRLSSYDCFLFFDGIDNFCDRNVRFFVPTCTIPRDNQFNITFINNTAPLGSAIFGSAFRTCPWNNDGNFSIPNYSSEDILTRLKQLEPLISFQPPLDYSNVVNTVASLIRIYSNDIFSSERIEVMPGEEFTTQLGAVDILRQSVPLTVFSQLSQTEGDTSDEAHSVIGETDRYLLLGASNFTNVPIRVYGNANTTFNVTITSNEASAQLNLSVFLTECATGYRFDDSSHSCVCEIDSFIDNVLCLNNGSIQYPVNAWIGQEENKSYYIIHNCILDYCQPNVMIVNLDEPDTQCQNSRSGILCGGCIPNYSSVLGSTSCMDCSSNYSLFLIILFVVLGIFLVTVIAALNMTIADGYINGFIFYGNIVSVYIYDFLPLSTMAAPILVMVGFTNLDFGIETCFFNGMKGLDRVGLELVFPVYLAGILLTITILAKYGKKNILCKVNFTRVFATLLLLSYSSMVQTCIDILGYVVIETPQGNLLRWKADPNVTYFGSYHALLYVISILLLVLLIPFPLLLLFPSVTLRLPYIKKMKPLVDAFCGPLANHGRFWVGFRLYIRLIVFCITSLGPENVQLLIIAVFLLLVVFFQAAIKPFSNWTRNLVDFSLMLNLVILTVVAVYLQPQNLEANERNMQVTLGFTSVFCVELALLIAYYIIIAIPATRKFSERIGRRLKKSSTDTLQKIKEVRKRGNTAKGEVEMHSANTFRLATRQMQAHRNRNDPSHMSLYIGHDNTEEFETTDFIGFRESVFEHDNTN